MVKDTCSKCGEKLSDNRIGKYRYCNACHAEWTRVNRPLHSELNDEQKMKANARSYANVYVNRGTLIPEPCENCGNENAEKHHEDYTQPLLVKWLCRPCHLQIHRTTEYKNV